MVSVFRCIGAKRYFMLGLSFVMLTYLLLLSVISIVQLCTMQFCRLALQCAEGWRKEWADA